MYGYTQMLIPTLHLIVTRPKTHGAKVSYRLRFPFLAWLHTRQWEAAITLSQSKLGVELRSYNMVPKNSAIFNCCRRGDLMAMQTLLRNGKASILDVHMSPRYGTHETLLEVSFSLRCYKLTWT